MGIALQLQAARPRSLPFSSGARRCGRLLAARPHLLSDSYRLSGRGGQGLVKVRQDIFDIFYSHAQPDHVRADASHSQFVL